MSMRDVAYDRVGLALWVAGLVWLVASGPLAAQEVIGREALLASNGALRWRGIVNDAPADGATADVNPPRMRWCYVPNPLKLTPQSRVLYRFRLQIARDASFDGPLVDVETDCNFYNALGPLPGPGQYVWRVGYACQMACWDGRTVDVPREDVASVWSPPRRFRITNATPVWDRSCLQQPDFGEHPRLGFRADDIKRLETLTLRDPVVRRIMAGSVLPDAHRISREAVWQDWPTSDTGEEVRDYYAAGRALARAAFAMRIGGERRFANVREIFARIATYRPGGRSSPEGMGGDSGEDSTSVTEFLALAYDWFYDDYTPAQRAAFEASLAWRVEKWLHEFRWGGAWYTHFRRGGYDGPSVSPASLFLAGGDHHWEGSMATLPAAIAIYNRSAVARQYVHLLANYLVGVGERGSQDGCGDQGLSYGQSHLKWLMFASLYLDTALPALHLGRNPWYRQLGRFYIATTPVGMTAAPWGRDDAYGMWWGHRRESFDLLAALTGDPAIQRAWQQVAGDGTYRWRPWLHVTARLKGAPPDGEPSVGCDAVWPSAGWVASHAIDPLDPRAYEQGVGVVFVCRPAHHGNTFFSNNAFQMYAFGETINHGGGGAEDPLPFHTMSHNTILVDGIGQAFGPPGQGEGWQGALLAYKRTDDYVYWAADATAWYPHTPQRVQTWKLRFDPQIYGTRDVAYLQRVRRHVLFVRKRYVVVLDDLAASQPARWTWLWHVLQPGPLTYDEQTGRMTYKAGRVPVIVQQVAGVENLAFEDREGVGWLSNPLTGEDFATNEHTQREVLANPRAERIIPAHNVWLTTREPMREHHFLSVIYPVEPSQAPPDIQRLDDWTVRVRDGERTDVISFDPETRHAATIRIDLPVFQQPLQVRDLDATRKEQR